MEAGPAESPGGPHEAGGNAGPRWMAATPGSSRGTKPAYRPTPPAPRLTWPARRRRPAGRTSCAHTLTGPPPHRASAGRPSTWSTATASRLRSSSRATGASRCRGIASRDAGPRRTMPGAPPCCRPRSSTWRKVPMHDGEFGPVHPRLARLADYLRGHWAIEALHHLRDVTFAEDASQTRTGATQTSWPAAQPGHRRAQPAGPVNVAAGLRRHARDPRRPLATLGISPDEPHITTERRSPGSPDPLRRTRPPGAWARTRHDRGPPAPPSEPCRYSTGAGLVFLVLVPRFAPRSPRLGPNLRWLVVVITAQRWCA